MDRAWLTSVMRPLLVVLMVSSIDLVVLTYRRSAPDMAQAVRWSIAGMGILAAIIGCTTTTWLAMPTQRLRRSGGYRVAEIALLVAVAAVLWLAAGDPPVGLAERPDRRLCQRQDVSVCSHHYPLHLVCGDRLHR